MDILRTSSGHPADIHRKTRSLRHKPGRLAVERMVYPVYTYCMPKWFKHWPWYRKTGWILWVGWMLLCAAMIASPAPNTRAEMVLAVVVLSVAILVVVQVPILLWHKFTRRNVRKPRTVASPAFVAHPVPAPMSTTNTPASPEPPQRRNILGEKGRPLYSIAQVYSLSPSEFEQLCVRLLARMGYKNLERTGGAGDLMADIKGVDPDGRSFICQCKRYQVGQQLGSPLVQTFIGMQSVEHKAQSGMIITTATFTDPAITLAFRHNITLINGTKLMDLLDRNDLRRF